MELFPAIDLRHGRSVRLLQGSFAAETQYSDDPVALATAFAEVGARWVHVVDLDAARTGQATQRRLIAAMAAASTAAIQVGGGVRTREDVVALLASGVTRVVLGTIAIEHPDLAGALIDEFGPAIAIGVDARGRDVATHGWERGSGVDLLDLIRSYSDAGAGALIVTEIGRDGTLSGPDLDQLTNVLAHATVPVIASGGVGTLDDLARLRALRVGDRALAGAIVGRALSEQRFTVGQALALLDTPEPGEA